MQTNRSLQQLAAAYNWAIQKMEWIEGPNPASEVKVDRFRERPSKVTITPAEYRSLGQALREIEEQDLLPQRTVAAIRLILQTGARPYEILSAELAWCDLDSEHPRIERPQGKGDRAGSEETGRTIWLSGRDLKIIRSIQRPPGCKYLIPGDRPDRPLTPIQKAWDLMCKRARLEDRGITPKTARHAYRSQLPHAAVEPDHGRELLGHKSLRMMEKVYWHPLAAAQGAAAEQMGEHIADLLGLGHESRSEGAGAGEA